MSKKFDKHLEQATDSTLVEPNWDAIIACFDTIRAGEAPAKPALASIRKRLQHENPHVVQHALLVLDACVKNCGSKIHCEIATRDFMEDFKNLVTESKYEEVKNKALEMLQCWATAFANKPEYKMIVDTHNLMKLAGFDFPSLKEADAMFMAQVAPEWQEGPECFRCRTAFSLLTRKHHCRACGQIFCDRCSQRELALPQFGIEKEVRVCETCFEQRVATEVAKKQKETNAFFASLTTKADGPAGTKKELTADEKEKLLKEKEEEELALALAISQSEAEAKESERSRNLFSIYNGVMTDNQNQNDGASLSSYNLSDNSVYKGVAAPSVVGESPVDSMGADDPLARYLNRDYWQQKKAGSHNKVEEWAAGGMAATAPPPSEPSIAPSICSTLMAPDDTLNADVAGMNLNSDAQGATEVEEARNQTESMLKWCETVREQVAVMEKRIRSNIARGRSLFNDTAVKDIFERLTRLHADVLDRMHTLDDQQGYYETLQDQLGSIGEARQAINVLREEFDRQRKEQLAEEQRKQQAQMQQTLEMMRRKKHTMLMEQREQALQRFYQQQQEMATRRVQQQCYPPQGGYAPSPTNPQQQQQPVPGYYGYQPNSMPGATPYNVQQQQQQQGFMGYQPQNSTPHSNGAAPAGVNQQNGYYGATTGQSAQGVAENPSQQFGPTPGVVPQQPQHQHQQPAAVESQHPPYGVWPQAVDTQKYRQYYEQPFAGQHQMYQGGAALPTTPQPQPQTQQHGQYFESPQPSALQNADVNAQHQQQYPANAAPQQPQQYAPMGQNYGNAHGGRSYEASNEQPLISFD